MKVAITTVELFLVLGAAACSSEPAGDAWSVTVTGEVSVANGLVLPEPGWIWTAIAPAELSVTEMACAPVPPRIGWGPHGFYRSRTSTTTTKYGIVEAAPNYPKVRTYVAFTGGDSNPLTRPDPRAKGTLYGQSEALDAHPCGPDAFYPSWWGACYGGNIGAHILVDSVFPGCDE